MKKQIQKIRLNIIDFGLQEIRMKGVIETFICDDIHLLVQ
jgi:hypothetical protein